MINSDKSDVLSSPSLTFMELQELLSSMLQAANNDPRVKKQVNDFAAKKANQYLAQLQEGSTHNPQFVMLYQAYTNLDSSCSVSFMDKNTLLKPFFIKQIEDTFNQMCKCYKDGLNGVAFNKLEEVFSLKQVKPYEFTQSAVKEDILNDHARKISTTQIKDLVSRILLLGKRFNEKYLLANEITRISEVYNINLNNIYIPKQPLSVAGIIESLDIKKAS
jgi:hypothetical protein